MKNLIATALLIAATFPVAAAEFQLVPATGEGPANIAMAGKPSGTPPIARAKPGDQLLMDLEHLETSMAIDRVERHASGNVSISGPVTGGKRATLTVTSNGTLIGQVEAAGSRFVLTPAETETLVERHVAEAPPVIDDAAKKPERIDPLPSKAKLESDGQIDLLVAYTPSFAGLYRTHDEMLATIENQVARTNDVFANTGTDVRVRMVGHLMTTAEYPAEEDLILHALAPSSSKYDFDAYSVVDDARAKLDADVVVLYRKFNEGEPFCGLAFSGATEHSWRWGFLTAGHPARCYDNTLAHELGHLMGAGHEAVDDISARTSYAFGHVFAPGVRPGQTIMAARPNTTRVPQFSDPDAVCVGFACGSATANMRRLINETHHALASFSDGGLAIDHTNIVDGKVNRGQVIQGAFDFQRTPGSAARVELVRGEELVLVLEDLMPLEGESLYSFGITVPHDAPIGSGYQLRFTPLARPDLAFTSETFEITATAPVADFVNPWPDYGNSLFLMATMTTMGEQGEAYFSIFDSHGVKVMDTHRGDVHTAFGQWPFLTTYVYRLDCETRYQVALTVETPSGTSTSPKFEAHTGPCGASLPADVTAAVDSVTTSSAAISVASTDAESRHVVWGPSPTKLQAKVSLDRDASAAVLPGLTCGSTYYYRPVAVKTGMSLAGDLSSFTTEACAESTVVLSASAIEVDERSGVAAITAKRIGDLREPALVEYTTVAGTADESDFQHILGRLRWRAGEGHEKTVYVRIWSDDVEEQDESFLIALTGLQNANLPETNAIVTIKASTGGTGNGSTPGGEDTGGPGGGSPVGDTRGGGGGSLSVIGLLLLGAARRMTGARRQ